MAKLCTPFYYDTLHFTAALQFDDQPACVSCSPVDCLWATSRLWFVRLLLSILSANSVKRTALFWVVTHRVVVNPYWHFGTACRSHLQWFDHDQQHCYHHASTVKPEAATAVVELTMIGVRTPETCWAVHKREVINLRNCCI